MFTKVPVSQFDENDATVKKVMTMLKTTQRKWGRDDAMKRIDDVRHQLIERGFKCLSSGEFGLPSYTEIQAWGKGHLLVYLIFDHSSGGWNILNQIDNSNETVKTWNALNKLVETQS
jgi:hypothetical protein